LFAKAPHFVRKPGAAAEFMGFSDVGISAPSGTDNAEGGSNAGAVVDPGALQLSIATIGVPRL
jgi:hypothetical protein